MKYIIEIPEEDYNECKFRKDLLSLGGEPTDLTFNMRIETLIANGIPLEDIKEQYDKGYKDGVKETFIEELEKIRDEAYEKSCYLEWDNRGSTYVQLCLLDRIINNYISELKGENNAE